MTSLSDCFSWSHTWTGERTGYVVAVEAAVLPVSTPSATSSATFERTINKLKGRRTVVTRYNRDYVFCGTLDVASIRI
jgi:hypothetical protein